MIISASPFLLAGFEKFESCLTVCPPWSMTAGCDWRRGWSWGLGGGDEDGFVTVGTVGVVLVIMGSDCSTVDGEWATTRAGSGPRLTDHCLSPLK
jgi:hypothetical protein